MEKKNKIMVRLLRCLVCFALTVAVAVGGLSCSTKPSQPPPTKLRVYVAAGLSPAMDEMSAEFTRQTGILLEIDYAGSGVLLSRLKVTRQGDLFLPAEPDYIDMARKDGLVKDASSVAYVWPVILVAKGNPKGIATLADLARPDLRIGLGNPESCQIGRASLDVLKKNAIDLDAVGKNVVVRTTTVNELGLQVKTGHLDATIVWDATARLYAGAADAVQIPPAQNKISQYQVAVLSFSKQPTEAGRFVDFLRGPDARTILVKHGFSLQTPVASGAASEPASRERP